MHDKTFRNVIAFLCNAVLAHVSFSTVSQLRAGLTSFKKNRKKINLFQSKFCFVIIT